MIRLGYIGLRGRMGGCLEVIGLGIRDCVDAVIAIEDCLYFGFIGLITFI